MIRTKLIANYWFYKQSGGKNKWITLDHNGVLFPPEYQPHRVPIVCKGKEIILDPEAEEIATLYAKYIETDYINSRIFKKNFWKDWKKILGDKYDIDTLEDCDFRLIYNHLLEEKEKRKGIIKEEFDTKYKTALLDGKEQPVGNFRIEPPGIFMGRGACNPKLGKIKPRIYPEDITINIGKEAKLPEPYRINSQGTNIEPISDHKWGKVIHDKTVEWLASWKDYVTGKVKYVWLGAHSDLKAQSDMKKFEIARKLKRKIKQIKEDNDKNLKSSDSKTRQIATALYFIDNLALRVGNEKGDDETDTVGVTSLRVEHIHLLGDNTIKLDFEGKDSVPYKRKVVVDPQVYKNLEEFTSGKEKSEDLFNLINSGDINKYLQSFMKNLTAKVFRTYNASNLFQKELKKISNKFAGYEELDKINILLDEFNKANAKVAMLCNHQKNINKSTNKQLEKIDEMIKKEKTRLRKMKKNKKAKPESIKKIQDKIKKLKAKKMLKTELKNVSLGTSKINYIDPRITVAFMKKHNLPIEKIFSKALQEKFKWAMDVDPNYKF